MANVSLRQVTITRSDAELLLRRYGKTYASLKAMAAQFLLTPWRTAT